MRRFLQSIGAITVVAMVLSAPPLEAKPGKGGNDKQAQKGGGQKAKPKAGKGNPGKVKPAKAKGAAKAAGKHAKAVQKSTGKRVRHPSGEVMTWRFADRDRDHVTGYFVKYRDRDHGLPPGLAKNLRRGKDLPPGWRKKLRSGYVLDDVWWDAFTPVDYGLFPDMRRYPDTGLYLYGDRIVRVYEPRREVIDVIIVPTIRLR